MLAVRIALLAAMGVVAACSSSSSGEKSGSEPPGSGPGSSLTPAGVQPSRIPDGPTGSRGPVDLPASSVDAVVAEVSRLAGVPVAQVTIRSAEYVTFPDGGLGCPVPGMVYTQVLTEGFKIVAEAGGKTYDFRGTGPDRFRLCTNPQG